MICRAALVNFEEMGGVNEMSNAKKVEILVGEVLGTKGIPRKDVVIETHIDSECDISDDDY